MSQGSSGFAILGSVALISLTGATSLDAADFRQDVLPILQQHCVSCHGPEEQESFLRLDTRGEALKGGMSGPVIVVDKSAESLLIQHVTGEMSPRMPHEKPPLTANEIGTLVAWIDAGAPGPDDDSLAGATPSVHWGFVPPERPALPGTSSAASHPIDLFVRDRLVQESLLPSAGADRVTLLRRLSLDLIGLPPTIEEVEAFKKDRRPRAWERQIDRLLASPHYGERWGRLWLDAARYADSDGFEKDKPRAVWFFRDWVVGALNRDLPYDQFVIEQIAGDLLPDASQDQIVATGFLRNSMINEEGGIHPEQFRMEAMFDRMDAIGKGILGITVQCAQCHNHKFDPISQRDYYRLFAFLNDSHEGSRAVYTPEDQATRAQILRETRAIEDELQHRSPDWLERMAAWEDAVRDDQPEWTVLRPTVDDISTGGARYLPQPDGSFLQLGYAPTTHRVKLSATVEATSITGFRLELLKDPNLPLGGPGRSLWGTGALSEFEVEAAPMVGDGVEQPEPVPVAMASASADVNPPETVLAPVFEDKSGRRRVTGAVAFAIDAREDTAWGIDVGPGRRNVPRKAVFVPESPVGFPSGTVLDIYLAQRHGGWNSNDNQNYNLGRVRLSYTTAPAPVADPLPAAVRQALGILRAERTPGHTQALFSYWRTTVPEWHDANRRIEALWDGHPEGSSQLVLQTRGEARRSHVLKRGDYLQPESEVAPGVPRVLHPLPEDAPRDRLSFARWLVDRRSPTAARSIVNRVWQAYFGTGLVATPENFGLQGEAPSHPELLDWLSVDFMDQGWSLKRLHRQIVTSHTYRQSSVVTPALLARDPYNRLLARGPRVRLDAEIIRDSALAASGLLNTKIGGPSIYPLAPASLFEPPASYGLKSWPQTRGAEGYRRALYTFRYRSVAYPPLQVFDAPDGNVACVRRARTNTPLQALTTLNEPLFVQAARALARESLEAERKDKNRARHAFRRVLSRSPTSRETSELLKLLRAQRPRFSNGQLNPWNLATDDPDEPVVLPRGATMEDLAAWTAVSRVILNLDEAITKQ